MLNGKKFPQNVRALRILVEELLRKIIKGSKVASYDELMLHLDDLSGNSRTVKLWVNIVIKFVFLMMLYIRAERESDWPLHPEAVKLTSLLVDMSTMHGMDCFTFGHWINYQLRSVVGS